MSARITLYGFGMSQNAVRPEIALHEKGLAYERVEVNLMAGEHRKPPLTELSPRAQVPTLVYDDGSGGGPIVVYESIATIRFIDDLQPEPPLMPPTTELRRRAQALVRIEEFQAKLDGKNIFGSVAFRKQTREQLGERVDALLAEIPRWDAYLRSAGSYLAGEHFTLADIAVFPLLLHFEVLGYDYAKHTPALADYIARCKARESVIGTGWVDRFQAFAKARGVAPVLADT